MWFNGHIFTWPRQHLPVPAAPRSILWDALGMIRGVLLGMELWTAQSWGVDCLHEHLGCLFCECDVDSFRFYVDIARNTCGTNLSHGVQMARWSVNYWQSPSHSPKLTWEWFIFAVIIRYDAICSQLVWTNYIVSGCAWTWCIATMAKVMTNHCEDVACMNCPWNP